jgi:hypothetical protein
VPGAVALIEKLNGTVTQKMNPRPEFVVAVSGEVRHFEGRMFDGGGRMVQWVIETIVPKVLSPQDRGWPI